MKTKTFESKTDTQPSLSPCQAERAEAQETPVLWPDPLGATLVPPGSEATLRAHAAGLNRATAGRTLRQLQRQYGNRYVQRVMAQRRGSGEGFTLDDETAGRINRARGGGQPLDGAMQAHMSEALGHDFSGVRVHTDSEAYTLNRLLNARAFTTGHDIFFGRGEYSPGSGTGRELIAHELTHVAQQSTGRVSGGGSGITVRPAGDTFEQEADALASRGDGHGPLIKPSPNGMVCATTGTAAQPHQSGSELIQRSLIILQNGRLTHIETYPASWPQEFSSKATDKIERKFKNEKEIKAYLGGSLDYLGEMNGDWIRLHPNKLLVLGEKHGTDPSAEKIGRAITGKWMSEAYSAYPEGMTEQGYRYKQVVASGKVQTEYPRLREHTLEHILPKFMVAIYEMVKTPLVDTDPTRGRTEVAIVRLALDYVLANRATFEAKGYDKLTEIETLRTQIDTIKEKKKLQELPAWKAIEPQNFSTKFDAVVKDYMTIKGTKEEKITEFAKGSKGEQESRTAEAKEWETRREYYMYKRISQAVTGGYRFVVLGENHMRTLKDKIGDKAICITKDAWFTKRGSYGLH